MPAVQRSITTWCALAASACGFTAGGHAVGDGAPRADAPLAIDAPPGTDSHDAAPDAMAPPPTCLARWHDGSLRFADATAIDAINSTTAADRDPFLVADELTIYFNSDRAPSQGADVWMATRATLAAPFGTPVLAPDFNSTADDTKMSLSGNGLLAVISSARTGGQGAADIWYASRADVASSFAFTEDHVGALDTADPQFDPQLSADGLRLYYAPVPGGLQEVDLATRATTTDDFGAPTRLPINDTNDNGDPGLSADETIIAFSSTRNDNTGLRNLWYATRATIADAFGTPIEIPDVNTTADEGDPVLSSDGCRLYFSSTRAATGTYDIYVASQVPPP